MIRPLGRRKFLQEVEKIVTEQGINIAVIDTETNWDNEVMSIGVVLANAATFKPVKSVYYIFKREAALGGMYSRSLQIRGVELTKRCNRNEAMPEIRQLLQTYKVEKLFAYNASFDMKHLPELKNFHWYDIMKIAAYRQFNAKIPSNAEFCKTGRLRNNYGVEPMMRLLSGNRRYAETHNALQDAVDELKIMELLGLGIGVYEKARLNKSSSKQGTPRKSQSQATTKSRHQTSQRRDPIWPIILECIVIVLLGICICYNILQIF